MAPRRRAAEQVAAEETEREWTAEPGTLVQLHDGAYAVTVGPDEVVRLGHAEKHELPLKWKLGDEPAEPGPDEPAE